MGKRAPKLPVASAGGEGEERRKVVAITDSDWQRIEKAYGQKLSEARGDIREKTQEFVDRAEFEQNAEPVSDARDRISTIIGAASSLRSALDGGDHDADGYARTLIKKHLRKKGDAIKKRRRKKDDPLRGISSDIRVLIFASQDALRELDDAKDQGFSKGEAWKRWSNELTDIAKAHDLHWRVRKDSDKQKPSDASPFVKFVWELQQFVPGTHRRAHSKVALAKAITEARRQAWALNATRRLLVPPKPKVRRMTYALAYGMREHAKCFPKKSLEEIASHFGVSAAAASAVIDAGKWQRP
jgi:hypothetical protein